MESVIKHLVEITRHRDHDLLNISVITALRELTRARSARVLDVISRGDQVYIQPRITVSDAGVRLAEDAAQGADEPITAYPELCVGIAAQQDLIEGHLDTQEAIWLPVWMNEKLHTCLEIVAPAAYTTNTLEVLEGVLIVYRNFQNLLDYSERDSLTGLLNRKTFDDSFSKVIRQTSATDAAQAPPAGQSERRSADQERQSWLAVLDIDHFKRVNDQFGHLYGDEVLILIANLLRASFRPSDRLFRFGGEEFVILLRSTSQEDAQQIFDRFRENIARHTFPQVGQVTVSIGYAVIEAFEPAVAIIGRADQALYYAKSHGRNQTCYYDKLVRDGLLHVEQQSQSDDQIEFF